MPELLRSLPQTRAQPKVLRPSMPTDSTDLPHRQIPKPCNGMCEIRCCPQCREKCGYPAGHREFHCCLRCLDGPQPPLYTATNLDNPNTGTIWRISSRSVTATPTALRHAQRIAAARTVATGVGSINNYTNKKARTDNHTSRCAQTQPCWGGSGLCLQKGSTTNGQMMAAALFWTCVRATRLYELQQLAHRHYGAEALCNIAGYKGTKHAGRRQQQQQPQTAEESIERHYNRGQKHQKKHHREITQTTITWWVNDDTRRSRPCTSTCTQGPTSLAKLKTQVCEAARLQSSDWYISGHTRHQRDLDAGNPSMQVNLSVRGRGGGYDHSIKPIDIITFRRDTIISFEVDEHATVPATMIEQARCCLSASAIITTHPLEAMDGLQNCSVHATDGASIDNAFSAVRKVRRNAIKDRWEKSTGHSTKLPSKECYICTAQLEIGDHIVQYGCQHMVHKDCHEHWTEGLETSGQPLMYKCTLFKQNSLTLDNAIVKEDPGKDETGTLLCISITGARAQAIVTQARKQRIHSIIVFLSAIHYENTNLVDAASITATALSSWGPRAVHDAVDIGPIGATFWNTKRGSKTKQNPTQFLLLGMSIDVDIKEGMRSKPPQMTVHERWCRSATVRIMAQSHAEQDAVDMIAPAVLGSKHINWQTSMIKGSALAGDMRKGTESLCIHTLSVYGVNAPDNAEKLANAIMNVGTSRLEPGTGIWILPHAKLTDVVAMHINSKGLPLIVKNIRRFIDRPDIHLGVTSSTLLIAGLSPSEVNAFEYTIQNDLWRKDWHPPMRIHTLLAEHKYAGVGWHSTTECSTALAIEGDDLIFMIDPRGVLNPHCLVEEIHVTGKHFISCSEWIFAFRSETDSFMNMIKIAALPGKRDDMTDFFNKCQKGDFHCQGIALKLLPITITKEIPRTTPPSNKGLIQLLGFNQENHMRNKPWWNDRSHSHDLVISSRCVTDSGGSKDCQQESHRAFREINMPLEGTELNPVRITMGETHTTATAWQQRVRNATTTSSMSDGMPESTPKDVIRRFFPKRSKFTWKSHRSRKEVRGTLNTHTLHPNTVACFALGPDSHITIITPGEEHSMHISAPTWFAIHHPRGNVTTAARHKYIDECRISIQGIVGKVWQVARRPRTPFGSQQQDPQATPQATHGGAVPAAPPVTPTVLVFDGPRDWIINGLLTWHRPEAQHLGNSLEGSHQAALRLIELLGAATNQAAARYTASWISEHIRAMIRKNATAKKLYGTGT